MMQPTARPILVLIAALALAALACNAAGQQPDSAATIQAVYATITAQAASAGVPVTATAPAASGTTGEATETPAVSETPDVTPTAPESRAGNGVDLTLPRCSGPITVDGDSTDWDKLNAIPRFPLDSVTFGQGNWTGPADLSGFVRACWTDSALYLLAEVIDDVHVQTQTGGTAWKGDEVELQFDGDLRGDFYDTHWNSDDTQIGLSPGDFGDLPPAAGEYFPSVTGLDNVQVDARRPIGVGGNYTLEASVPWTALRITPQAGTNYGMCVAFSDDDQPGQASQDSMVSHCTRLLVPDPTSWVSVGLSP